MGCIPCKLARADEAASKDKGKGKGGGAKGRGEANGGSGRVKKSGSIPSAGGSKKIKKAHKPKSPEEDEEETESLGEDQEPTTEGKSGSLPTAAALAPIDVREVGVDEIKKATGKFAKANLVGIGPTGEVYHGTWEGKDVAVKRFTSSSQTEDDFLDEVEIVSKFRHPNVVQLLAYCTASGHRAFVYEYASVGNLFNLLHGKKGEAGPASPLSWTQRIRILRGAAQGLAYLHNEAGSGATELVHKRVKSSNVLVFEGDVGKISDLKFQSPDQDSVLLDSSLPLGNFAGEAPETFTGEMSQKSDVYSFGIVLLEALSGKRAMSAVSTGHGRPQSIKEWAASSIRHEKYRDIVDPLLDPSSVSDKSVNRICKLATSCTQADPSARPDMKLLVKYLERVEADL